MADWLSYSIQDFVPLSLETFQRLTERYNARFQALVVAGAVLGLMSLLLLPSRNPVHRRLLLAAVGVSWLWIGWAYQLATLAPLVWAAELFALAFALQSGLLLAVAAMPKPSGASMAGDGRFATRVRGAGEWIGVGVLAFAVTLPLIGLLAGRSWEALSVFGTGADATAIGTLGIVMRLAPRVRLLLMPVPVLWCLISALMQRALGDPLWVLPGIALAGVAVALAASWAGPTEGPKAGTP